MKVLFLCQRVPWPPDRGDRITTWHLLRHLLDRGARVRVGCFAEEERDGAAVAHLQGLGVEVCAPRLDRRLAKVGSLRGLLTGKALTLPFFRHRDLAAAIARWWREAVPDLVHVYSSSIAQYVLDRQGAVRVMQFAELDSDKWRQFAAAATNPLARWIYRREARTLLRFETAVAKAFDLSLVVSEAERELFERCIPGVRPVVLPNGVDVDHFHSKGDGLREPHTAIFTGVMDYEPNVDGICWFARECWPAIRARFPDAKLLVVGSRPVAAVQALTGNGIEVTGRVPETPPFFDRAAVAIAPLRLARGVQNKVLEALSMGLPVVCSPQAAQGITPPPAGVLMVAADAAATIAAVTALFAEPACARGAGAQAANWVREHYRWEAVYERYDRELARLPSRKST